MKKSIFWTLGTWGKLGKNTLNLYERLHWHFTILVIGSNILLLRLTTPTLSYNGTAWLVERERRVRTQRLSLLK
ncbi:MAG: hypothetical protein K1X91_05165 [Bacteriodetes bacterium]|nr:hypothetical protein [Bacteroidota bacterium]